MATPDTTRSSITIAVPALNEERHLERSIATILRVTPQWFDDFEVLIFDDGSTDRTGEIADALAARHEHVQAFHHDEPACIGGVIRHALEIATMEHFIWVDGKGATPDEALGEIFARRGDADLVVPHTTNQHERHWVRQAISWSFRSLLNALFFLDLRSYTHLVLCRTADLQRIGFRTDSYAFQAELLIKLIRSGRSYVQIGVEDYFDPEDRTTKAFRSDNVIGVARFLLGMLWDEYLSPSRPPRTAKGRAVPTA